MKVTNLFLGMNLITGSIAQASPIQCIHRQAVQQREHASYDYVTEYEVQGVLLAKQANLRVVSREYSLKKLPDGKWVVDYQKKGNVHVDVDLRSHFKLAKTNGINKVYTTSFKSDRTGVFQYNLAFIVTSARNAKGEFTAVYAKSSSTDDAPFHEKIALVCK